jgi:hypothetical protein
LRPGQVFQALAHRLLVPWLLEGRWQHLDQDGVPAKAPVSVARRALSALKNYGTSAFQMG